MAKDKLPTDTVTVEIQAWAHRELKSVAAAGLTRPQLANAAAIIAFTELPGEVKAKYLAQAQARAFDAGRSPATV